MRAAPLFYQISVLRCFFQYLPAIFSVDYAILIMKAQVMAVVFLRKGLILILLLCLLIGTVCAQSGGLAPVTQVQVICHRGNFTLNRVYVQPHKIASVLNYLRLLKSSSTSNTDPEQIQGDSYLIIVYDANGAASIYRQQANKFFSKNGHPWKALLPEQAGLLYPLLQSMSSDEK